MNSEGRRPKPKEIRRPKSEVPLPGFGGASRAFGFRLSAFFRPSHLGLRI